MKDTFKAAVCIGRQPYSDVWVFGPDLQLTAEGDITNHEASSILWVQEVFNMEEGGKMHKKDQTGPLPSVKLPLYSYSLRDVIKALINTVHDNTMAAIFTIGMACLNFVLVPDNIIVPFSIHTLMVWSWLAYHTSSNLRSNTWPRKNWK